MPAERSAGIILFKKTPEGRHYLLLRSRRSDDRPEFWDFPKGVLEGSEKGIDAAKREAAEETGLKNFKMITGFKETVRYFTRREGKPIPKFVAMFLAEAENGGIKISWEHDKSEWLSFEEARERLSVPQMKEALKKAEEFLSQ